MKIESDWIALRVLRKFQENFPRLLFIGTDNIVFK
jgi:hypothetical protein